MLAAIIRENHILLPSGTTVLEPNDTVIAVAGPDAQHVLRDALVGAPAPGARRDTP